MRRLILLAIVLASVTLTAGPAGAAEVKRGDEKNKIVVRDERPGDETRRPPADDGPVKKWFGYDVVLWDPATGLFCVDTRYTQNQGYAERVGRIGFNGRFDPATGAPRPTCPDEAVAVPTARQIAADVWQHVENLPVPTLDIQPDHAITGKKVYLEIRGARTWSRTIDNPIGEDVVITATSDYLVDWGDPTYPSKDVTRSQGGPYPNGDVTHVYTTKTEETRITVTQRWTATWRAGAVTGTLAQLMTTSPPLTLEVRELEAVRQR
jgi:hypothetical protein